MDVRGQELLKVWIVSFHASVPSFR
jgi:hypothetical protein